MTENLVVLRKCKVCGIEAHTEEELELFAKTGSPGMKYGRRNLCKKCYAEQAREYRKRRFEDKGLCRNCGEPNDRAKKGPYCSNCLEKLNEYTRIRHWTLRLKAIQKLGGRCVVCGISDPRLLTINHREGRNYRTTIDRGDAFYYRILSGERETDDLEVRCYNCNALYEFEMGYRQIPEGLDPSLLSQFEVVAIATPLLGGIQNGRD